MSTKVIIPVLRGLKICSILSLPIPKILNLSKNILWVSSLIEVCAFINLSIYEVVSDESIKVPFSGWFSSNLFNSLIKLKNS